MNIHPYLLARLYAIQEAFETVGLQRPPIVATNNGNPKSIPNSTSIWDDLLKDEDDGSTGGGGGGTMKGLRGKNHLNALRRLGR